MTPINRLQEKTMDNSYESRDEPTQNERPTRVGHILSKWEYN